MSATFSCVSQGRKTVSLDFLASYSQVQLSSSGQIGADQLQIGQLDGAIVALRIQELQQRSTTVVVSIGYGVADRKSTTEKKNERSDRSRSVADRPVGRRDSRSAHSGTPTAKHHRGRKHRLRCR